MALKGRTTVIGEQEVTLPASREVVLSQSLGSERETLLLEQLRAIHAICEEAWRSRRYDRFEMAICQIEEYIHGVSAPEWLRDVMLQDGPDGV